MAKTRVLVLGATGFIGKHIFDRLIQRDALEVTGTFLTNQYRRFPQSEAEALLLQVDLTDKKQVSHLMFGVDIVIQAAAATSGIKDTMENPEIQITDNAIMNPLIFSIALRHKVKQVIIFSSSIVYSPLAHRPLYERDALDMREAKFAWPNHFGAVATKIYLENLAEFYSDKGATGFTVIRPANIYGPGDRFDLDRSHVLATIVNKVLTSQDGKIHLWGEGEEEKDLLFVSDLVDLVELALGKQKPRYNVSKPWFNVSNAGSGQTISVKDLAQKIIEISGRDLSIEWDPKKPTALTKILLNNERAKTFLGWKPKVTLEEGLKQTIEWFKANQERIKL